MLIQQQLGSTPRTFSPPVKLKQQCSLIVKIRLQICTVVQVPLWALAAASLCCSSWGSQSGQANWAMPLHPSSSFSSSPMLQWASTTLSGMATATGLHMLLKCCLTMTASSLCRQEEGPVKGLLISVVSTILVDALYCNGLYPEECTSKHLDEPCLQRLYY